MSNASASDPTPWHENDEFWTAMMPFVFSRDRLAMASAEADAIIALTHLEAGQRVLDVGCGIGRHAIELALRGLTVCGVDRTREYLARARKEALARGAEVEWVEADMRAFVRPARFNVAINFFTSFGYFDDAQNAEAAQRIRTCLRPGGHAIFELVCKEALDRDGQQRWWDEAEGSLLLRERTWSSDGKSHQARWILIRGDSRREFHLRQRIYSSTEFAELLASAGFKSVRLFGNLNGDPFDEHAVRLIAVGAV